VPLSKREKGQKLVCRWQADAERQTAKGLGAVVAHLQQCTEWFLTNTFVLCREQVPRVRTCDGSRPTTGLHWWTPNPKPSGPSPVDGPSLQVAVRAKQLEWRPPRLCSSRTRGWCISRAAFDNKVQAILYKPRGCLLVDPFGSRKWIGNASLLGQDPALSSAKVDHVCA
jgi:hypothetical protein